MNPQKSFLSVLALSVFLFAPAFAAEEPDASPTCCAKKAYCCTVKAKCCGKTVVEQIVPLVFLADQAAKPTCCEKRAYCCVIKSACCGKKSEANFVAKVDETAVLVNATNNAESTLASLAGDTARPTCCAKKAYCCKVKSPCCGKTIEFAIVR